MKYTLDLYQSNGLLKAEISRASFHDISVRFGDVLRAIPSGRWLNMEDIISYYRNLEHRLRYDKNRSDADLISAVNEMVAAGIVKTKGEPMVEAPAPIVEAPTKTAELIQEIMKDVVS